MGDTDTQTEGSEDQTDVDTVTTANPFITGTVTDTENATIQGATVTFVDSSGTAVTTATTDSDGDYTVSVAAETYDISVEFRGYDPQTVTGIVVEDNETVRQDVTLERRAYKVSGELNDDFGFGVFGRNTSVSGTPIGVRGSVPNASGGFGLETPDDARIAGTLATLGAFDLTVDGGQAFHIGAPGEDNFGYQAGANVVGGYVDNGVQSNAAGVSIGGGGREGSQTVGGSPRPSTNEVTGDYGTIAGGYNNRAGEGGVVGGGTRNTVTGEIATVSGGEENEVSQVGSTIGGGQYNRVTGYRTTIGGGYRNEADTNYSTIAGGDSNRAEADYATIGGGGGSGVLENIVADEYGVVGGGAANTAGNVNSSGTTDAMYATVPGGGSNTASGRFSFAAGRRAEAVNDGTFVWADNADDYITSTGADQFIVVAGGGVGIGETSPETQFHVSARSSTSGLAGHTALIEDGSASNSRALAIKTANSPGNPASGADNYVTFYHSDDSEIGSITGNGSGGVNYGSAGADYAEYLPRIDREEVIEPADVVGVVGGEVTKSTADATDVMVVSDRSIVTGNSPGEDREDYETVAFVGQVPTKVRGAVTVGDLVVPSGADDGAGRAVAADDWTPEDGPVVGRAWGADDEAGVSAVTVAVGIDGPTTVSGTVTRQRERIETLERENDRKDERIAALEDRLGALEAQVGTAERTPADD